MVVALAPSPKPRRTASPGAVSSRAVLALLLGLLPSACGGGEDPPAAGPGAASAPAATKAPSGGARSRDDGPRALETTSEPGGSGELGALRGTVLFEGEPPERFELGAASKAECKHHPDVDQRSDVLVVNDGRLAGAFVHLRSGYDAAKVPPPPARPVTLDQRGCMYLPHTVGVQTGQRLLVLNSDPTTHNVNLAARRNKASNRSMGASQPALEFVFDERELPIRVKCDIHPWMSSALFVEEHPWFAVSADDGSFRIPDVPPGEYVVEAVHEVLGDVAGKVTVRAGETTVFSLTLSR